MRRKSILIALVALAVAGALAYFYGGSQVPSGQPPLQHLTAQNLVDVRSAFNAAQDDVRLLVLVSPT